MHKHTSTMNSISINHTCIISMKYLILIMVLFSCKQEIAPKTALYSIKKEWDLDSYSNIEGYPKYPTVENRMYEIAKAINDTTIIWFTVTKLDYTLKASYDDYRVKRKLIRTFKKIGQ